MKFTHRTLLAFLIICVAIFSFACPKKKPGKSDNSIPDVVKKLAFGPVGGVILSREVRQTTPKGAPHYGKTALSDAQLGQIDEGLDQLFASAREDGFKETATKPYSFFEIFTPPYPCIPAPVSGTPGFLVPGGLAYDGSEFDQYNPKGNGVKDGRSVVFAAEMVLSVGTPDSVPPVGQMYVCPDPVVLTNGVRHGGDHIFLANFGYTEEFHQTGRDGFTYANCSFLHTTGIGHPLLPRNGRCAAAPSAVAEKTINRAAAQAEELPISDEVKAIVGEYGLELNDNDRLASGTVIRAVK